MQELFPKVLWCGLLALALQYLYVGWRLQSDRRYAGFGVILLLGWVVFWPMAGILPHGSGFRSEVWVRVGHLAALASLPILAIFLARSGVPSPGRWFSQPGSEGLRTRLLLLGCGALGAGALADAARLPGPCYAFLGFVGFAAAANWTMLSRFLEIHRKTRATLDRLASAYALLQENAGLRELGASAAMISHEIRNYVSTLKGNAVLMGRAADAQAKQVQAEAIRTVALRMEAVTQDIAAFASSSVPVAGSALSLRSLLEEAIGRHFPSRKQAFRMESFGPADVIGDADKLEQVFLNLARNAFEAGAGRVDIRLRAWRDRLILAIEDDGEGCLPEDLARIATPFYTGRRELGGTGLGCSIAASILKAHGASFRMYAKNALGDGRRGMVINAVFPRAAAATGIEPEVVVVAGGPEVRACILQPLLNLGLRPYLLSGGDLSQALQGSLRGPLFLAEDEGIEAVRADWGSRPVFAVDARRVARRENQADRTGTERFLLSEENMAGLLAREAPGRA